MPPQEIKSSTMQREAIQLAPHIPVAKEFPSSRRIAYDCSESVIRRHGNDPNTRRYTMTFQSRHGTIQPLFEGYRDTSSRGQSCFVILMLGTTKVLATVRKVSTKGNTIRYELYQGQGNDVILARYDYEIPSVFQTLTDTPPRRAVVRIGEKASAESVEPYSKGGGQKCLDFGGRGREASKKNMQLQDEQGHVVLQFVKWSKDIFHLDFASPLDALVSMGFAIAQFDL